MKFKIFITSVLFLLLFHSERSSAQFPRFKVLAFYSKIVEGDHVDFAMEAVGFFRDIASGNGFVFDTTSSMNDLTIKKLEDYSLIMMINDFPHTTAERDAFRKYMENGGGWYGFHVAAYNDGETNWPWFVDFLGGAVFWRNCWPRMPAKLILDDVTTSVTKGLPGSFISPLNEWYQWKPSPRLNKNVKVMVSLSPDNYPLGLKDIIPDGDLPVVWTNTGYRMIYLNMGHGKGIFSDATQNMLIINVFRWLVANDKKRNVFEKG
jgi:uncharacterized protein